LLVLLLFGFAPSAMAQLRALETENFVVVYFPPERYLAPYVARCFENALHRHEQIFDYKPTQKITLLLQDFGDAGNAGASAVPNNRILITIAPFSYIFEVVLGNERMNWMSSHELVHILATDKPAPRDMAFRRLFGGKVSPTSDDPLSLIFANLTTPRYFAPRWYHEGVAVFMETWLTGGLGRAMGAYDEMVWRTAVAENAPLYDLVGLESAAGKVNFQVGVNAYLYGTRFVSYVANTYGPEKVVAWVSSVDHRKPSFKGQFKKVFGLPLGKAWSQWLAWERTFQAANLTRLRANPITVPHLLTAKPLGSVSRPVVDRKTGLVYLAVDYPGQVAHIASLDPRTGAMRRLTDVKGPALFTVSSLALDATSHTLFFTTDNNDLRDLRSLDVSTGRTRMLMKDARIGDLAFDAADRSLWGVRHYNGISTLVRIPPPYTDWKQVYSFPYGTDLYDLDVSPDGTQLVAALTHIDGSESLVRFETTKLLNGDTTAETLQDFENSSPAGFRFSPDGRYLFGSSYYSGVSNLYRVDLATKNVDPLTNADTGFFRPLPISDDELLAFYYTSAGFAPALVPVHPVDKIGSITFLGEEIVKNHPIVTTWKLPPPSSVDLGPMIKRDGDYHPFGSVRMRSVVPAVLGYKNVGAYGLRASFSDSLDINRLALSASYTPNMATPKNERLHLKATYSYLDWTLHASLNNADFYDLFGPTKASRKGYAMGVEYKRFLVADEPKQTLDYDLKLDGYGDLETLPGYQNVQSTASKLVTASAALNYKFEESSLGAVEPEKGFEWHATLGDTLGRGHHFPTATIDLDVGVPLPFPHSSVWLRTSFGAAAGDRTEPFANFYFGGFGNNWVDDKDYRRLHEQLSFPGVKINEIGGHDFAKAMLEWNLPPLVFRHVGTPSLFLNWASLALFTTGLETDVDKSALKRQLVDAGAQLDVRFVALTHHQFTLSFGYASAYEHGRRRSHEKMVSLKIPLYE
jgi:hypothetical protein